MWGFFTSDPVKSFPFEIGEEVSLLHGKSLWSLHKGKKKANGESVSIFSFDIKGNSDTVMERNAQKKPITVIVSGPSEADLARACYKRVKTLRHPHMLTYLDGLETDKLLYIVTEPVVPLLTYLHDNVKDDRPNELAISWGLYTVTTALSFMVNDCSMVHNNVCIWSVFVNRAGDWLLGGVEFSYRVDQKNSLSVIKTLPYLEKYDAPEKVQTVVRGARWAVDSWGLGCLVWETFNGALPRSSSLKAIGKIPKSLVPCYCELVGANPKSRPNPAKFIENCRVAAGFMRNTFIDTMLFLDEIQIKDATEKTAFFQKLTPSLDSFPSEICRHKLLPQLIIAFEYGNSGAAILAPLLKVGKTLESGEYQKTIIPCVIKLFSSPDRNTRVKLLHQIETFVEHLTAATVNEQIFPHIVQGFSDTSPVVREATIKAMMHLACKLNYKNINEEVMKHFARLQTKDDQGGIRTNTTVCLGKIACYIDASIRQKILMSAFTRATRDPFVPARQAGILAMAATQHFYQIKEIALKLLPTLCALTLDPDKGVRDQAFKAMHGFIEKLRKVSDDPSCLEEMEKGVLSGSGVSAGEGVSGWAGWAVSGMTSLTSRIYKSRSSAPDQSSPAKGAAKVGDLPKTDASAVAQNRAVSQSAEINDDGADDVADDGVDDGWGDMDLNEALDSRHDSNLVLGDDDTDVSDWGDDDDWGSLETFDKRDAESPVNSSQSTPPYASSYFVDTNKKSDFFSVITNDEEKAPSRNPDKLSQGQDKSRFARQGSPAHMSENRQTKTKTTPTTKQARNREQNSAATAEVTSPVVDSGWETSGWGDSDGWDKQEIDLEDDETRKRREREEKRKQRQRELESKREERKSGAMKLGSKKVGT